MVLRLNKKNKILPRLYKDCVTHVEEISLIEEDYLWENVTVYVNDLNSMDELLLIHVPSFYRGGNSLSAYMTAKNPRTVQEFADILRKRKNFQTHLQTSATASYIERSMPWLTKKYIVRYCRADSTTFKPCCTQRRSTIRLTPDNIKQLDPSASPIFVKRLETAPVFGYLNEKGELVATSGIGWLTKKSFSISYTETRPEYRGQGIAKCLTSFASEPLIKEGLVGIYAADVKNPSSLKVADALGFRQYRDLKCFYN
jgi:predicted GNAT family acetyltransferase